MKKKIKDSLVKIKNNLIKVYKTIVEYIITNRLFISYVILCFIGTLGVRYFTIGKLWDFLPIITDLGLILLIGAIGYLVRPKNQFKYYFIWTIIFALIFMISSIYYRFFTSFASIMDFATLGQTETVTGSIFDRLKLYDVMYLFGPVIFYLIHKKLLSSAYYFYIDKIEKGKKMIASTALVGVLCLSYSFGVATNTDYSRLVKQWDRLYLVQRFGIITYQVNDVLQFLTLKINSITGLENAQEIFNTYFDAKQETKSNKYTGILKGKNVIFVHMESMQTFLMDLSFNGKEATPNLNKLAKEGMFFENFYPQVSTGTSSDTEFTLLTGLMPASSGTVFVSYYDRNYRTIPKILKENGYYTFSMHGNLSSMWNRYRAHPSLGYEGMYYSESFEWGPEDKINLGINDRLFFKQAIPILENIEKTNDNYMGTIITLSNHSPFKLASEYSELDLTSHYTKTDEFGKTTTISNDYLSGTPVGEYIKSANYADMALGDFMEYINKSDAFNDTVFVFYGDHDAKLNRSEINYLYNLNPETGETYVEGDKEYTEYDYYNHELNKKTPLIIWTKNKDLKNTFKGTVSYTTGMYNVAATILNMYGIYNKYNVGEDIFSVKDDNIVVFPSGNVLSNKLYYSHSTGEYARIEKGKINRDKNDLDDAYIKNITKIADDRIEVSNSIIVFDLLDILTTDGE